MKKYIQTCLWLFLLALALPQLAFSQSEKRIMEQICDTRPALKEVMVAAGVSATLMGDGPYTFFAPSEAAVSSLPPGDLAQLNNLLMNHVVPGKVLSQDLKDGSKLTTLGGATLSVFRKKNKLLINGVEISEADLVVRNGVIHTVQNWLITPDVKAATVGQLR